MSQQRKKRKVKQDTEAQVAEVKAESTKTQSAEVGDSETKAQATEAVPVLEEEQKTQKSIAMPKAEGHFRAPDFNVERQYGFVGNSQDQVPSIKLVHEPQRRGQYAGFTWISYRYWGNSVISYYPVHFSDMARSKEEGEEKNLPYLLGNWQTDDQGKIFYPNGTPRNNESAQMAREYLVVYDLNEAEALHSTQLESMVREFDGSNQTVYEEDVFGYNSQNFQEPVLKNNPSAMEGFGIGRTEVSTPTAMQDMAMKVANNVDS